MHTLVEYAGDQNATLFATEKHNMACVFHSAQSDADVVTTPSQVRVGRKHLATILQPIQVPVCLASPPAALCVEANLQKVVFGQ